MTKIAGSGVALGFSSQRHGSVDPDPDSPQNVMDPEHWCFRSLHPHQDKREKIVNFFSYCANIY
jgi:hypothetical protein